MSDKTSQRTEEEMLDQTFVGYDDEMTVQTEDGAKDAAAEAARGPARFYVPTDDAARIKPGSEKGRFSKDVPTVDEAMNKADKTEKMLDKLMH